MVSAAKAAILSLLLCFACGAAAQIDLCKLPGDYPFPFKSDDFCDSLKLRTPNNAAACQLWGFLLDLLASQRANPLTCVPDNRTDTFPKTRDVKGRYIPQPLPDRRTAAGGKLPAALNATSVLAVEGGSLNWLFKNIIRFAGWAPCEVLTGSKAPWRAPPGFRRVALLNLTQDLTADYNLTATSKSLPAVVILKQGTNRPRNGTCWGFVREAARPGQVVGGAGAAQQLCSGGHLVVLIRGTLTVAESILDFTYNTVPAPEYGAGQIHKGFKIMADEFWDTGLKDVLTREFVNGSGPMRHITIAGHSLGAAVATLLTARAQKFLQEQCASKSAWQTWPKKQPLVTGVMFAAPHVGDSAFTQDFDARVNARRVVFEYDLTSQVPCTPQVTACPNAVVSTQNPSGAWNYSKVGGELSFGPEDLPTTQKQQTAWKGLKSYDKKEYCASNGTTVFSLKTATHICSYLCKTSVYTNDTLSWCRLWRDDGVPTDGSGAYCLEGSGRTAFPLTPAFPPMP